ncbi:MAG: HNH endonuclease signature motif containing protein [Galbitalea sp.]
MALVLSTRATSRKRDASTTTRGRTGKLAADTIAALLRLGLDADPNTVFNTRRPAVRVVVAQRSHRSRVGHGSFESGTEAISLETVDRFECEGGTLGLVFDDDGHTLNLGRTTRDYTTRQRIAMAVRDGGCRFGGCERPISWCEAHHINEWLRDHGETNVDDGIMLCRTHHMLIHDNHWRIPAPTDNSGRNTARRRPRAETHPHAEQERRHARVASQVNSGEPPGGRRPGTANP